MLQVERGIHDAAIAAETLGFIERGVGFSHQRGLVERRAASGGNADADGDVSTAGGRVRNAQRPNRQPDGFGDLQGGCFRGVRQHDGEFLAAIARGQARRIGGRVADGLRHRLQAAVAGLMSVGVVVALEIVDIEQQHRNLFTGFVFAPQEAVEGAAVGEPGQSVGRGELGEAAVELGQLVLHPLAFGDIADDAEKFRP